MSKFQAFNKYILTGKVRIILAFFAIFTAVFYFFTRVNLAVSLFFAFVVMGIIEAVIMRRKHPEDYVRVDEDAGGLGSSWTQVKDEEDSFLHT